MQPAIRSLNNEARHGSLAVRVHPRRNRFKAKRAIRRRAPNRPTGMATNNPATPVRSVARVVPRAMREWRGVPARRDGLIRYGRRATKHRNLVNRPAAQANRYRAAQAIAHRAARHPARPSLALRLRNRSTIPIHLLRLRTNDKSKRFVDRRATEKAGVARRPFFIRGLVRRGRDRMTRCKSAEFGRCAPTALRGGMRIAG